VKKLKEENAKLKKYYEELMAKEAEKVKRRRH